MNRVVVATNGASFRSVVNWDGVLWSFACPHLHHTAGAASVCSGPLETLWNDLIVRAELRTIQARDPQIFEFGWTEEGARWTRRFSTLADDWQEVTP